MESLRGSSPLEKLIGSAKDSLIYDGEEIKKTTRRGNWDHQRNSIGVRVSKLDTRNAA